MDGPVQALAVFDDGSGGGPALYAGGNFRAIDSDDDFVARWQGCGHGLRPQAPPVFSGTVSVPRQKP